MPEETRWWCTPCNALRPVHRIGYSIGSVCDVCGSGRVRPPLPQEIPQVATRPPAVSLDRDE